MNKKRIVFCLSILLIFCANVFAQNETICRSTIEDCWKKFESLKYIEELKAKISEAQKPESLDTDVLPYYFKLGVNYYLIGDYSNALSCFDKPELDLAFPDTKVFRGLIYLDQGKNDEALKEFDSIINRKLEYPMTYYGRAEVFRQRRDYDDAIKDYDRELEKNFRFSKAFFGRAIALFKRGESARRNKNVYSAEADYKNALKDLNSVKEIDLDRTPREVYFYSAKIYEALGDETKAKRNYEKYKDLQ